MSFTFGNTSTTFGTPPAKPTAFGAPLSFGTPATTAQTGFGGFGSTFGTPSTRPQPTFGSTFGQPATGATAPAFGSTFGQPAASATPAFGSTFGQPTASAAVPAFGSTFGQAAASAAPAFGSTFSTPATTTPLFGSTFGAPATSAPAFGSTFGTPATSTPAFGSTFGVAASTTPAFGTTFGAPTGPGLFGATSTTKPSLFGTPATTATSLFGAPATTTTSLFGAPAATAPNLFGGGTATQAPSLFGTAPTSGASSLFGNTVTTTTPSLFNPGFGTTTTTASSLFGGTGSTGFGLGITTANTGGFGLFGSAPVTTSAPSLFSGFAKTTTTGSGFTGFGTGTTGFGTATTGFTGFGAATTTTPSWGANTTLTGVRPPGAVPTVDSSLQYQIQQILSSFYSINVFGDERDNILKKWNMLQASWGTGKGYYNSSQPPIEYNVTNPLYRYKSIGYVIIPGEDNTHGLVKLIFNKKESELSNQKEALSNGILGILGNKPNLSVIIKHIKGIADNQTEVMFSVSEKGVTGSSRKILALDLCTFLNQPLQKQQLTNVGVSYIAAFVKPTQAQLQEFLKNPPTGVELQLWEAAQADNPNVQKFMPTLYNGFFDLKRRILQQQYETEIHQKFITITGNEVVELKKKHANSIAKINEIKQKYAELHHRLLKIIVKQEVTRKVGTALQPEEELLRGRLQTIIAQLNSPAQFKSKIHEIHCNMDTETSDLVDVQKYKINSKVQGDIKQFLKMEQNGISQLVKLVNADLKNLKIISEGLEKMQNKS